MHRQSFHSTKPVSQFDLVQDDNENNNKQSELISEESIKIKVANKHYQYLEHLLINYDTFKSSKKKSLIDEKFVQTDVQKLGDRFLKSNFEIRSLKDYFSQDTWHAVLNVVSLKVKLSTCLCCNELCLKECVMCSQCYQWFVSLLYYICKYLYLID
jgi:hypothetical protein